MEKTGGLPKPSACPETPKVDGPWFQGVLAAEVARGVRGTNAPPYCMSHPAQIYLSSPLTILLLLPHSKRSGVAVPHPPVPHRATHQRHHRTVRPPSPKVPCSPTPCAVPTHVMGVARHNPLALEVGLGGCWGPRCPMLWGMKSGRAAGPVGGHHCVGDPNTARSLQPFSSLRRGNRLSLCHFGDPLLDAAHKTNVRQGPLWHAVGKGRPLKCGDGDQHEEDCVLHMEACRRRGCRRAIGPAAVFRSGPGGGGGQQYEGSCRPIPASPTPCTPPPSSACTAKREERGRGEDNMPKASQPQQTSACLTPIPPTPS